MKMGAKIGNVFQFLAKFLRHGPGLQRAQPDAKLRRSLTNRLNQLPQGRLSRKIHAPGGDLDAGDHQLPIALLGKLHGLLHRQLQGRGAHRPTSIGNDAVTAEIDTAILHLQKRPRAVGKTAGRQNFKFSAAQGIVKALLLLPIPDGREHILHKFLPLTAAAQHICSQRAHRLGIMLGIAAADTDDGLRMLPPAAADHRPVFLIRHRGDGAGIDDIPVALLLKAAHRMSHLRKKLLHCLGLILVCLAAEGIKSKFHVIFTKIFMCFLC